MFNVKSLCECISISRSGYYKWLKNRNVKNQYDIDRELLSKLILEIHQSKPSYGYRRIASKIRTTTGWIISDNLVHKCCRYLNIKSKVRHYKYKRSGEEHIVYPNLIKGNWRVSRPLEKVVSDMTCIYFKGKLYNLTFYLDVFNNEIISYKLSNRNGDPKTYYDGLKIVLEKIKGTNLQLILHTDQGSVYSSRIYKSIHQEYNIIRSMSRSGTPTDNPIIESINGWIKQEMVTDFQMYNHDNLFKFIDDFIYYYNNERPSYKLNYKTPIQYKIESGF